MSDMLAWLRELDAETKKLEAANEEFAQEVVEVEKAAARADAYRQVVNAQASHNWGYYQHLHKDELDGYWAQTVDDIVLSLPWRGVISGILSRAACSPTTA